jgi:hypothetical protein
LMAPPETIFHHWISTQHQLSNFGEFSPLSRFLSSPSVDHKSPRQARDSLHPPLSEFTCYFLGTPGKYPGTHTCRLSITNRMICLLICLSYQVGQLWGLLTTSQSQFRSHGNHLGFRL